ncbi:MAG: nucleoside hydrolase [Thalassobaculales bacterium]
MPLPIIIDTDPGCDDAVAILLALASPEFDILGLTTVAGNVSLDKTTANALRLVELAGRPQVPVLAGCPRPILRPLETAEQVNGESGMDGAGLPPPSLAPGRGHAVGWMVATLRAAPQPVTLVALGPLTNLALALVQAPDIAARIARIALMGGAARVPGNTTASAEYNILVDPHAAAVVFGAGVPITMFPLDVTHKVLATPERLARLAAAGSRAGTVAAGVLGRFSRDHVEKYGAPGSPLHDPCPLAWLIRPALFRGRDCHVAVDTHSPLNEGRTVVDWWGRGGLAPNATVMHEVDAPALFDLLADRLARLP